MVPPKVFSVHLGGLDKVTLCLPFYSRMWLSVLIDRARNHSLFRGFYASEDDLVFLTFSSRMTSCFIDANVLQVSNLKLIFVDFRNYLGIESKHF